MCKILFWKWSGRIQVTKVQNQPYVAFPIAVVRGQEEGGWQLARRYKWPNFYG